MNEIAAPEGYDGGGPSHLPIPDINYEPIDVEVDSIQSFAKALKMQAENMETVTSEIKAKMGLEADGKLNETTHLPVGGGQQDLTVTEFARNNSERMAEISSFLDNVQKSLTNLGKVTETVAKEFENVDGLNAVEVNDARLLLDGNQETSNAEV